MNGSTVQNHISFKMVFEYCVIRKFSYQSWFLVYLQLPQARLLQHPRLLQVRKLIIQIAIKQSSQVKVWIDKHGDTSETPEGLFREPTEVPKPNKNENHEQVRGSPCSKLFLSLEPKKSHMRQENVRAEKTNVQARQLQLYARTQLQGTYHKQREGSYGHFGPHPLWRALVSPTSAACVS